MADQVFEHLVGKAGVIRRVAAKVLRSHARVKPVVGESIVERPLTGIQDCTALAWESGKGELLSLMAGVRTSSIPFRSHRSSSVIGSVHSW